MRPPVLAWVSFLGLLVAAAPAAAQGRISYGLLGPVAPNPAYQNPDGSYPSYTDFFRDLRGIPCGIECSERAAMRWGYVAPPRHRYRSRYHRRYEYHRPY